MVWQSLDGNDAPAHCLWTNAPIAPHIAPPAVVTRLNIEATRLSFFLCFRLVNCGMVGGINDNIILYAVSAIINSLIYYYIAPYLPASHLLPLPARLNAPLLRLPRLAPSFACTRRHCNITRLACLGYAFSRRRSSLSPSAAPISHNLDSTICRAKHLEEGHLIINNVANNACRCSRLPHTL